MSESANTFNGLKPEMKEAYAGKKFKKIKESMKKCKCSNKCGCKK